MIPDEYSSRLAELLDRLKASFPDGRTPDGFNELPIPDQALDEQLKLLIDRLASHYPFHRPEYAGQMLKPPHPAAWLAYSLAMTINPNNHALDGGPESSEMEKEVITQLKSFAGFPDDAIGHLTSSGTIANLEALWVARELHPHRPVAVSGNAHYTHQRMCRLLNHPVVIIPDDDDGLPDPGLLNETDTLPGTVVVTLGTTGTGRVEPLHRIMEWARRHDARVHVDAAYGGFFHLLRDSGLLNPDPWQALADADSLVIDPHKHGLQPYGCGSVLFRDPAVGRFYKHDSPYTYFSSDDLHLGEISLECSRAGSAAVALWFTLRLLPLIPAAKPDAADRMQPPGTAEESNSEFRTVTSSGPADDRSASPATGQTGPMPEFAHRLSLSLRAAQSLYSRLDSSTVFQPVMRPELDIVVFVPVTEHLHCTGVSSRSVAIFKAGMEADPEHRLYLSTLEMAADEVKRLIPGLVADSEKVTVLRTVLMKPEHFDFIPEMVRRLHRLYEVTSRRES
ncbi:aminotransferase class V-fold PLP-dependent enzyme [Balneolales bacterium ANBcel1]|nr:aminotransferase class V-fold PLP-dependent enzyme [Balneolales bacterium ANBcel1]